MCRYVSNPSPTLEFPHPPRQKYAAVNRQRRILSALQGHWINPHSRSAIYQYPTPVDHLRADVHPSRRSPFPVFLAFPGHAGDLMALNLIQFPLETTNFSAGLCGLLELWNHVPVCQVFVVF